MLFRLLFIAGLFSGLIFGQKAAIDTQGFIYVAETPTISKYAATGDKIIWTQQLAGDSASGIAIAPDGSIVVATTLNGSPAVLLGKPANLYLAKFNADGKMLASTHFGSSTTAADQTVDLKIDASGNIVIAGNTVAADFPTTPGVVQPNPSTVIPTGFSPGSCRSDQDQFVASFDSTLTKLRFSTRLGTGMLEATGGLAIGADGSLFVSGTLGLTRSPCFGGPLLTRLTADASAIIYRINPMGGSGGPIAVDPAGKAFFASDARGFLNQSGSVLKVDPQGTILASSHVASNVDLIGITPAGMPFTLGTGAFGSAAMGTVGCAPPTQEYEGGPAIISLHPDTLAVTQMRFIEGNAVGFNSSGQVITSLWSQALFSQTFNVVPVTPTRGTITCITNAANYDSGATSPGEITSMFGPGLGTPPGGILVKVDGRPVQLLYNGPDQFNLVTPFELTPNTHVRFEIYRDGILTAGVNKWVQPDHIGLFRIGDFSANRLAVLNQDGSVNGPDNAAPAGTIVALFGTGFGNLGQQQWAVGVGGLEGTIQYFGNAPTLVAGVTQMNVSLPADLPARLVTISVGHPSNGAGDGGQIYIKR